MGQVPDNLCTSGLELNTKFKLHLWDNLCTSGLDLNTKFKLHQWDNICYSVLKDKFHNLSFVFPKPAD
jgi:hypothetical protein